MSLSTAEMVTFLRGLRAVKQFTAEPVAEHVVQEILEVGRWTGSAVNSQPWEVVVVRDRETNRKLGDWGAKPAATAPVVLLIVTAGDEAAFDEGRLAERLLLAAAAHGLGSTVATLKNDGPDAAKRLLGIPAERRAVTLVALGHTDLAARRARPRNPQPRKPMAELAHWDRY